MTTPFGDDRPRPQGEALQFMQQLWQLVHALDVRSKRMARELGVTGPQRLVIRIVGQSPEVTAGELAVILGLHPSTLTGILRRLERQRVLERVVDPADRRKQRFRLTASGREIERARKGTVEAAVRRAMAAREPAEVASTLAIMNALVGELGD